MGTESYGYLHDIGGTLSTLRDELTAFAHGIPSIVITEAPDPIHGDVVTSCLSTSYYQPGLDDPAYGTRLTITEHLPDVHSYAQRALGGCAVMLSDTSNKPSYTDGITSPYAEVTTLREDLWAPPESQDGLWLRSSGKLIPAPRTSADQNPDLQQFGRQVTLLESMAAANAIVRHFMKLCERPAPSRNTIY